MENEKEAPSNIKESGVAIFDMSLIVTSKKVGSFIPITSILKPKNDPIIRGFVTIPWVTFLTFTFPPLKVSKQTTASTLNVGTTTPISSAVTPIFPSPAKDVATGIPNKTKLLRNIPWIITPLFELSFSKIGTIKSKIMNKDMIDKHANIINFGFITLPKSVV